MTHTVEEIPFKPDNIKIRLRNLHMLYKKIDEIPEDVENPMLLARKVTLYNKAQGILGELFAQSVYDFGIAYANRKEQQGVYEMNYNGTAKDKEAWANQKIIEFRQKETKAEAEMRRWEKAYNSTEMIANAIKKELEVVHDDYKAGGR